MCAQEAEQQGVAMAPPIPTSQQADLHVCRQELEQAKEELKRACTELERARHDLAGQQDLQLRARADLDNWQKRLQRYLQRSLQDNKKAFLQALLPIVDNLERALTERSADIAGLRSGIEVILRQLKEMLQQQGVTRSEAEGALFDPTWHEAMGMAGDSSEWAGRVIQVLEAGYALNGELLRPAKVIVGGPVVTASPLEDVAEGP
ncbi:MAG: nucleotide exchange factor GrpE [Cyanobacteria bacterium NC_groundwater_1444_Ag_S-0.65um_54_12]|nr:nucleotide exchange factor GrpE [Cyanobacteria bacterium NC_groundwater_1444_Ag_S-0.65um_54_12]